MATSVYLQGALNQQLWTHQGSLSAVKATIFAFLLRLPNQFTLALSDA